MKCKYLVVAAVLAYTGFARQAMADIITLGTAGNFAVLAGSTVTNTGPTVITGGDVGVSPGSAITGFPPGTVTPPSTTHAADGVALQAQNDLTTAYNVAAGLPYNTDLTGQDLGTLGAPLLPGVYHFDSSAGLTGTLWLNDLGDPNAQFVFQIASALTTAPNSAVEMVGGGQDPNLFWQVGSSATLDTGTAFEGNILALTSISLDAGASILDGRALARNGAVTLIDNAITNYTSSSPEPGSSIPEPSGLAVLAALAGLVVLRGLARRIRGGKPESIYGAR